MMKSKKKAFSQRLNIELKGKLGFENDIFSYLSIWIDSKSIVRDSSVAFTDNSEKLALGLTQFFLNKRTQVFLIQYL